MVVELRQLGVGVELGAFAFWVVRKLEARCSRMGPCVGSVFGVSG
jgi:hypothetical protein